VEHLFILQLKLDLAYTPSQADFAVDITCKVVRFLIHERWHSISVHNLEGFLEFKIKALTFDLDLSLELFLSLIFLMFSGPI
jgi:hypothetical protein